MGLRHLLVSLLGGSWVVITRVLSRITIVITHIRGLIAPPITTHEPPRNAYRLFTAFVLLSPHPSGSPER